MAGIAQRMTARLAMSDSTTAMWRLPTKSNLVPWGTRSKVLNSMSDAQLRRVVAGEVLHQDLGHDDGGEERGAEADDQRDREAAHRAGAELHQHEAGDQRGDVRVDDGQEHLGVALLHGHLDLLAGPHLLADALVDEHVRVDGHAQ